MKPNNKTTMFITTTPNKIPIATVSFFTKNSVTTMMRRQVKTTGETISKDLVFFELIA